VLTSGVGNYGTIIHPSTFCLLDRYPRFNEQSHFKALKKDIADYRDRNLQDTGATLPPWLEGLQLQASGVKAFRILVCGKTGVGKSTLINKVFGVELVIFSFPTPPTYGHYSRAVE
jgi:ribosome biogenesis GTPase A